MQPFQCGGYHNTVDLIVQHLYRAAQGNIYSFDYGSELAIIDENYGLIVLFAVVRKCAVAQSKKS